MRLSIVFCLCAGSDGLLTRKPADMSDLAAIADFATSAADLFVDAAKALPSPAEAQAALAAQDENEIRAMLAADAAERDSFAGTAAAFLSLPSADVSVANIRVVEPSNAISRAAATAQEGLDAALAALEGRQRLSEARVADALGSISNLVRE